MHLISTVHHFSYSHSNFDVVVCFFKSEEIHPSSLEEHSEKVCNCKLFYFIDMIIRKFTRNFYFSYCMFINLSKG